VPDEAELELELGRQAFARRSWREAYERLAAAGSPEIDDLEHLAVAAYLVGRDEESTRAWEQAHLACLSAGDLDRAARNGFWLALTLALRGEMARSDGWRARGERLIEEAGPSCSARGYLLMAEFLDALMAGDPATAHQRAGGMVEIAHGCGDVDLLAFGLLGSGQSLLAMGDVDRGVRLLDEAMVSVTTGEVGPIAAGIIYCAVIEACADAFDVRRAAEWTEALHDWCASDPDLVPYRGQCMVHRSEVLQARGEWSAALMEAEQASVRLADPFHPALGVARYQEGELHRLRGEFEASAEAYRAAAELGRDPAPGVALLRLAEGDVDSAGIAIRRMLAEGEPRHRPLVLAAAVEIHLARGDLDEARATSDELAGFADLVDMPLLHAIADGAAGAVLLAEGDPGGALVRLRRAGAAWRTLGIPYDAARARVRVAIACQALGDHAAAELEAGAARATFEHLGARPAIEWMESLAGGGDQAGNTLPLTEREMEVLRLIATGRTNREIAAELVISVHTVSRHVQNIFLKLDLSTRAAATAYAYEHHLL
jgi:ATP/maltotriose-dependent transcriptional regulator MalT